MCAILEIYTIAVCILIICERGWSIQSPYMHAQVCVQ